MQAVGLRPKPALGVQQGWLKQPQLLLPVGAKKLAVATCCNSEYRDIVCSMIKHRYAHEIDPNGGSAAAVLARMVEPGQRVLELGTGPGTVTRILHAKGCMVTGVEMDPETLATCAPFCERTVQANLEDPQWAAPLAGERFDAIICADVLEHLRDPRPLLNQLHGFLKPGGSVLMSLPNASHLTVVASLLGGRFPYQKNGLLDHTHLKFYGREDLDALLRECGLLWQHWHTVQVDPAQAELKAYWHLLDEETQAFLKAKCADGDVYQHVVRAQPATENSHLQKLANERAELIQAHNAEILALNHQLAAQNMASQAERSAALAQQQALVAHEKNTQATLAWTESQLQNHKQSIQELHAEIAALKQSTSWRITAPLRKLLCKISD
jgi:2-polyprenyl-3-methyl-5-hydroxy-6-metoxy-1,4-benzoquinol methylase/Skp family chaperone for outer membrane proteins